MDKLLTISIAAYNVEKYLEKLMQSLIDSHALDKLEILIINDGSSDHTGAFSDHYHSKYPNSVFHIDKENGGHGSTINKGIELATGKYFKVIDGDDWVDSGALADTLTYLTDCESDLVITDFTKHYLVSGTQKLHSYDNISPFMEHNFDEICPSISNIPMHAIIYKTEVLKKANIHIDEHSFYVDSQYALYPLHMIKTITYLPYSVYCHRLEREGQSMDPESLRRNVRQHETVTKNILDYYTAHRDCYTDNIRKLILYSLVLKYNKTFEIYFSFPCKRTYMLKIKALDTYINENCPDAYDAMPAKTVWILRKNIRLMYPLIWLWYRIKAKYKQN